MSSGFTFGVVIPGYRNVASLKRCLQSIIATSPQLSSNIVVVDDSGESLLIEALCGEFPFVKWLAHESNLGFGQSVNDGVSSCDADIVTLLNDDTELGSDPVPFLESSFYDKKLFAVSFRSVHSDGRFREGAKRLTWRHGLPRILHSSHDKKRETHRFPVSAYAVGGHAAYRRSMFIALHGFDPLFAPFYWEDVDLCRRAAQQGWHTIYNERCVVTHSGPSAIRTLHDQRTIRAITLRNRLLFAWRHAPFFIRPYLFLALLVKRVRSLFDADSFFNGVYRDAQLKWRSRHLCQSSPILQSHERGIDRG